MDTRRSEDASSEPGREQVVANQYGGIVPMYEVFYLESLVYAAGRAIEAFQRFDRARTEKASAPSIVANVHEALTHTAAVSRFFWPSRKSKVAVARAQKLRASFRLDEASPLYSRELRDALEHYDERLDTFLLQDMVGFLFPGPMVEAASLNEDRMGKIFRLVDPDTEEFVLLGHKYPFGPMRRAVEAVFKQANAMSIDGGRLAGADHQ
jgi:hypothetical protein